MSLIKIKNSWQKKKITLKNCSFMLNIKKKFSLYPKILPEVFRSLQSLLVSGSKLHEIDILKRSFFEKKNICIYIIYIRNYWKWHKNDKNSIYIL